MLLAALCAALTASVLGAGSVAGQEPGGRENGQYAPEAGAEVLTAATDPAAPTPNADFGAETTPTVELDGEQVVAGELIVLYESEEAKRKDRSKAEDLGGRAALVEVGESEAALRAGDRGRAAAALEAAAEKKAKEPGVALAEPNGLQRATWEPNDEFFPPGNKQYQLRALDPMRGWDLAGGRGSGSAGPVTVGVIDSGIDASNPDICTEYNVNNYCVVPSGVTPKILGQRDFANDDANAYDDGEVSHGTHVSGTVLAKTNNTLGIAAGSPNARLYAAKIFRQDGSGSTADLIDAINWLSRDKGVDVINYSGVTFTYSDTLRLTVKAAYDRGTVVVAGTGNHCNESYCGGNPGVGYPAKWPTVIAVGSVEGTSRADYSNYGPEVDVVAPGTSVLSTISPRFGADFAYQTGTSQASPFVAALAANLKARNPGITQARVYRALTENADDVGPAGFDYGTGYGRVDYYRALASVPAQ